MFYNGCQCSFLRPDGRVPGAGRRGGLPHGNRHHGCGRRHLCGMQCAAMWDAACCVGPCSVLRRVMHRTAPVGAGTMPCGRWCRRRLRSCPCAMPGGRFYLPLRRASISCCICSRRLFISSMVCCWFFSWRRARRSLTVRSLRNQPVNATPRANSFSLL